MLLIGLAMMVQTPEWTIPARTPKDVRAFVQRRMSCNHWGGEEPYDAERAGEIRSAAVALRCSALDRDERHLRLRHARRPPVLRLLTRSRDWME